MSVQTETEAAKMRRVPGIIFADGPTGRRARIAGTGIEVFEIIKALHDFQGNVEVLRGAFHWLADDQIQAALAYYRVYPDEIDGHLERARAWTPERLWEAHPFTKPPTRA